MQVISTTEYVETDAWRCDTCGGQVDAGNGYVVWDSSGPARDFRIIHQGRCDVDSLHSSTALKDLLGKSGIAHLLGFLTVGPLLNVADDGSRDISINLTDFVDLFRRLHVPNYEHARQYFRDDRVLDHVQGWNERAPYYPENLLEIASIGEKSSED